jgi:hypothetical protein
MEDVTTFVSKVALVPVWLDTSWKIRHLVLILMNAGEITEDANLCVAIFLDHMFALVSLASSCATMADLVQSYQLEIHVLSTIVAASIFVVLVDCAVASLDSP